MTRNAYGQDPNGIEVRDLQHSRLALAELNGQLERLDPINRLFMSSPRTYMIAPIVLFKFLLLQTSAQPYFILKMQEDGDWGSITLR